MLCDSFGISREFSYDFIKYGFMNYFLFDWLINVVKGNLCIACSLKCYMLLIVVLLMENVVIYVNDEITY